MDDGVGRGLNVHAALAAAGVVGLWEYRINLDLVICDEAMSRLYGIHPDEGVKGVPPSLLRRAIEEDDLPEAIGNLKRAIDTGGYYQARYRVKGNGGVHWISARAKPISINGRTVSLSGINLMVSTEASELHSKLGSTAIELLSLCRQSNDLVAIYFAEMLLEHISSLISTRTIGPVAGSA
ncbi:MAG: hypothetical protein EOP23_12495 [Hyphomicrobiales bacterium]|nr:MAG: hypothetical protein EOP23_12495 [Hyphomicrobiales bacterium]